jgi:hypothetical protein
LGGSEWGHTPPACRTKSAGRWFESSHFVVADSVSFAAFFTPLIRSVAPPLKMRPAALGSHFAYYGQVYY